MTIDSNSLISIFLALLSLVNGWMLVVIKGLQTQDGSMNAKLTALEVLVASSYLTRSEFQSTMTTQTDAIVRAIESSERKVERVEERFSRVEQAISNKQDRE